MNGVTSGEIVRREARRGPSANLPLLGPACCALDAEQPEIKGKMEK